MPLKVPTRAPAMSPPRTSGGSVMETHGVDHAQHGGDDPQRRRRVGEAGDGARYRMLFLVVDFQFQVHGGLKLMGIAGPQRQHAQVVAKKFHRVVVGYEGRELAEQALSLGFSTWASRARSPLVLASRKTA